jgi:hypothetical protein
VARLFREQPAGVCCVVESVECSTNLERQRAHFVQALAGVHCRHFAVQVRIIRCRGTEPEPSPEDPPRNEGRHCFEIVVRRRRSVAGLAILEKGS